MNIDTLRQAAVQAGVPPLVARGIFPYINPGERTIKGSQIKMAEDYNNQREIASFRDFTLNQLKAIHNIANDIIDELKYVNVTDDIALAYNQRIDKIAGDSKIPRYMLPVVIAGKSGDLMKLEETERHNREIERISNWNATIAQTRLNWEKSKPKDKNEFEVWLKDKKALREKYQLDLAGYNKIINEGVGGQAVREATNEALKTQGLIDALNGVIANATAPTGAKAGTGAGAGTGAAAGQGKDKDKAKNTGTPKGGGNPKPDGNKPKPITGDLIVTPPSPAAVPEKDGAKAGGQKPPKAKDGRIVF